MRRLRGATVLAVLLLTLSAPGCRAPRLDLRINRGITVFFVIGALGEYMGRHIVEGDDTVEGFYANEPETARILLAAVRRLAGEQSLEDDVSFELIENGRQEFSRIRSPLVSAAINSLYDVHWDSGIRGRGRDGRYHRTARLWINLGMIEPHVREAKLAFLAGAFVRFHRGEDIVLYNSEHKAAVLVALLRELGCTEVSTTTKAGIPSANIIRFTPTPTVARWLHDFRPAG